MQLVGGNGSFSIIKNKEANPKDGSEIFLIAL